MRVKPENDHEKSLLTPPYHELASRMRVWPVNNFLLITFIQRFFNSSSMENEVHSRTFILDSSCDVTGWHYKTQNSDVSLACAPVG